MTLFAKFVSTSKRRFVLMQMNIQILCITYSLTFMRRLTLSPCCKPAFSAGPPCTVHTMHAKVRPSDPVLPPTTRMPNPRAATKEPRVIERVKYHDVYMARKSDITQVISENIFLFIGSCVHTGCTHTGCLREERVGQSSFRFIDNKYRHFRKTDVERECDSAIMYFVLFRTKERKRGREEERETQSRFARISRTRVHNFLNGLSAAGIYTRVRLKSQRRGK